MQAVAKAAPCFGLETPLPLQPTQNYFQLIGWAFVPGAPAPSEVRVVVGDRIFSPHERIQRPDVAATYPLEIHAASCGFKFIGYLPFGFYTGSLEISIGEGDWVRLCTLSIPISSHPILGAIETSAAELDTPEPVRIAGWCFHPEFKICRIVLQFGNVEVPCDYGLARPDVGQLFPNHRDAAHAGFITSENLPLGAGGIKIRATTECGRIYFVTSPLQARITHGWIPNPPPASPVRDLSTLAWAQPPLAADDPAGRPGGERPRTGLRNILFALYGDFSANSALHVASFANALIDLGYDVVVAVPSHKETLGALPAAHFMALHFDEAAHLPAYFKDGAGPALVHAWTSRENVRKFSQAVVGRFGSELFVHLEDNEPDILATRLGRPFSELAGLPDAELDQLVPDELSHPRRAMDFLRAARGVTVIVDRLQEHVPPERPSCVIWPSADSTAFFPRPRDERLRAALGFAPTDIVLFYHGNTHTSNAREVRELYDAVVLLNQMGHRTHLIRAGRDFPGFSSDEPGTRPGRRVSNGQPSQDFPEDLKRDEGVASPGNSPETRRGRRVPRGQGDGGFSEFSGDSDASVKPYLIQVGHVGRAKYLPALMALADFFVQPGLPDAFNNYRFPSKLPEFFAIGRPVILPATNLGGFVRHGEDAWVLPRADAAAIADAITTLHADRALTEKLSRGAVAFAAAHFSWTQSTRRLVDFYRSLTTLAAPASS